MRFFMLLLPLILLANVSVTILPQKFVVNAIAPEEDVNVMVTPGNSPATYSPTFKELKKIKDSQIYFSVGVPFDKKYMAKIKELNPAIKIDYFGKYLKTTVNPHIWLSPAFLMLEAKVVLDDLIALHPEKREIYLKNYKNYIQKLAEFESRGLKEIKQKAFITFHPSFYYFSQDFNIKEIALEKEGKSPSFSYLSKVIKLAKENYIKTVIISPEFPTKYAKIVASRIGAKVVVVSPLDNPISVINKLIEALK